MLTPVLLRGDQHLLAEFCDMARAHLGTFACGALGDRACELVHIAAGAVVDDRDPSGTVRDRSRHRETPIARRRTGCGNGVVGHVVTSGIDSGKARAERLSSHRGTPESIPSLRPSYGCPSLGDVRAVAAATI